MKNGELKKIHRLSSSGFIVFQQFGVWDGLTLISVSVWPINSPAIRSYRNWGLVCVPYSEDDKRTDEQREALQSAPVARPGSSAPRGFGDDKGGPLVRGEMVEA